MTEYNIGDRVRAEKDTRAVEDVLLHSSLDSPYFPDYGSTNYLIANGWTLTVIEKAAPPLPTEPGHYLDKEGEHWELNPSASFSLRAEYGPFARLEPVAVTVEKIAAWLESEDRPAAAYDLRDHYGATK